MSGLWRGGQAPGAAGQVAHCVLAANPSPMTLEGTNTWIIAPPGSRTAVVIDPGPQDAAHAQAVLDAVAARGAVVQEILLTHGHLDHSGGALALAERAGVGVRALDRAHCLGDLGLNDGDVVEVGGLQIEVVASPGHSSDSLSFVLKEVGAVLTGDTVLGRGSTVVAHPDGRLADYLASLERLAALSGELELQTVLPGHGPALADPVTVIAGYRAHREQRLEQVRAALAQGAQTAGQVVALVYADVDRSLWPAAQWSVAAQLEYLQQHGHTG